MGAVKAGTAPRGAPKAEKRVALMEAGKGRSKRAEAGAGMETAATGEETRKIIIRNCSMSHQDKNQKSRRFLLAKAF